MMARSASRRISLTKRSLQWGARVGSAIAFTVLVATAAPVSADAWGMSFICLSADNGSATASQECVTAEPQFARALEETPDGGAFKWHDDETGHDYRLYPVTTLTVSDNGDGRTCRAFVMRTGAKGKVRESFRIACRADSGKWRYGHTPVLGSNDY